MGDQMMAWAIGLIILAAGVFFLYCTEESSSKTTVKPAKKQDKLVLFDVESLGVLFWPGMVGKHSHLGRGRERFFMYPHQNSATYEFKSESGETFQQEWNITSDAFATWINVHVTDRPRDAMFHIVWYDAKIINGRHGSQVFGILYDDDFTERKLIIRKNDRMGDKLREKRKDWFHPTQMVAAGALTGDQKKKMCNYCNGDKNDRLKWFCSKYGINYDVSARNEITKDANGKFYYDVMMRGD